MLPNKTVLIFIILAVITHISSCTTTPTISETISITPVASDRLMAQGILKALTITGGGYDQGKEIICLDNNDCLLFGNTIKSFGETTDFIAAKVTAKNKLAWARTYGGTHKDYLNAAIKSADNGYLLVGASQSLFFTGLKVINPERSKRPLIVHITEDGHSDWSLTMEAFNPNTNLREAWELHDAIQTKDMGYLLTGVIYESGNTKNGHSMIAVKIDANGKPNWAKSYDILFNDVAYALAATDNGAVIGGYIQKDGADSDSFVMKIDSQGDPIWSKILTLDEDQTIKMLTVNERGDITAVGLSDSKTSLRDIFMAEFDSNGKLHWANLYGSSYKDHPISLLSTEDSHLVLGHRSIDGQSKKGFGLFCDDKGKIKTSIVLSGRMLSGFWGADNLSADVYGIIGFAGDESNNNDILFVEWNPGKDNNNAGDFNSQPFRAQEGHIDVRTTVISAGVSYLRDNLDSKAITVKMQP